jgi:basic membrane protein A
MSKRIFSLLAVVMIASLALVACGGGDGDTGAESVEFKVCEVTDLGGVDDKSFNQLAWQGVEEAVAQLGVEGKVLESQQQTDYEANINAFIEEDCDMILSIGYLLADATAAAAEANPDVIFSIVDVDWLEGDNVSGIMFKADQGAFLAGYAAASLTETGKVGTFGGIPLPSVTVFMDGFYMGVMYYNEVNGAAVELVGWDPANPDSGSFTNNFESLEDARNLSISMIDEGVDIILPVGGPIGLGTAAAAQETGTWVIGVDSDWVETTEYGQDVVLTSILKLVNVGVFNTIQDALNDTWEAGVQTYTLSDDAVGLTTWNFSDELISELSEIEAGIIAGDIATLP